MTWKIFYTKHFWLRNTGSSFCKCYKMLCSTCYAFRVASKVEKSMSVCNEIFRCCWKFENNGIKERFSEVVTQGKCKILDSERLQTSNGGPEDERFTTIPRAARDIIPLMNKFLQRKRLEPLQNVIYRRYLRSPTSWQEVCHTAKEDVILLTLPWEYLCSQLEIHRYIHRGIIIVRIWLGVQQGELILGM